MEPHFSSPASPVAAPNFAADLTPSSQEQHTLDNDDIYQNKKGRVGLLYPGNAQRCIQDQRRETRANEGRLLGAKGGSRTPMGFPARS